MHMQYLLCRLYKDFVLEVNIIAVLGHKVEIQRGEGGELKQGIDMASDACHEKYGSVLSTMLYIPTQLCITCESIQTRAV